MWRAPGRVNLIGEHTDYNGGLALPFAIDRGIDVAVGRRRDRQVRACSLARAETGPETIELGAWTPRATIGWSAYPFGVLWALWGLGVDAGGLDLIIDSSLPIGAGLSSSAALEAAVAVAVTDLAGADLDLMALVRVCHQAEADYVGAPVGLLDPLAVLGTEAGNGLLIDFRSLATEQVPLTVGPLVVVDTGVHHDNAGGAYRNRRRSCEEAAAALGLASLREATEEALGALSNVQARRVRHVVTENARVIETARRLRSGRSVGPLLDASHESLRRDFEVSCPELDTVVEVARSLGAEGARMTGAGFGGSCIVVGVPAATLDAAVIDAFRVAGYASRPTTFAVSPSAGASRVA